MEVEIFVGLDQTQLPLLLGGIDQKLQPRQPLAVDLLLAPGINPIEVVLVNLLFQIYQVLIVFYLRGF